MGTEKEGSEEVVYMEPRLLPRATKRPVPPVC